MILMAMMLAATEPTPEALALGREISEQGALAAILSLAEKKDAAEISADASLSADDKAAVVATTARVYAAARTKLLAADARSYATHLSVEDLRVLAAHSRTEAAKAERAAMPQIVLSTMSQVGDVDLGNQIRAAMCSERKKLCRQ